MQQRASIARALAFDPDLLLMDEPFGALDEIVRDKLNEQLLRLWNKTGKTVVFVTHSIPEAVFLSTRVVVMSPRPGRIHDVIDCGFPAERPLEIRETPDSSKSPTGCATACAKAIPMPTEGAGRGLAARRAADTAVPIAVVVAIILVVWYVAALFMNMQLQRDAFANAGQSYSTLALAEGTMSQERPRLPTPHQIAAEIDRSVFGTAPSSKRSLVYHGVVTLEATLLGFAVGSLLGVALAVMIVHAVSLDRSLMPWLIASQTIPIIALAPMIVVIMNQFDVTGVVPKATISAYLSFFPVTVGMVKGLRSPDPLQLDLMRTYSASRWQTLLKLRLPASCPSCSRA